MSGLIDVSTGLKEGTGLQFQTKIGTVNLTIITSAGGVPAYVAWDDGNRILWDDGNLMTWPVVPASLVRLPALGYWDDSAIWDDSVAWSDTDAPWINFKNQAVLQYIPVLGL